MTGVIATAKQTATMTEVMASVRNQAAMVIIDQVMGTMIDMTVTVIGETATKNRIPRH